MEEKIAEQNDKLQEMSSTLKTMQEMMMQQGFDKSDKRKKGRVATPKKQALGGKHEVAQQDEDPTELEHSLSDETIYKEAIPRQEEIVDSEITFKIREPEERRGSSSSEEPLEVDTSDELMDVDNFIADCEQRAREGSRGHQPNFDRQQQARPRRSQGENMIREAENGKIRALATPGNQLNLTSHAIRQDANEVDQNYLMIGNIPDSLRLQILNHEYIDFAKLLPRDRLTKVEDQRMELINKGGSTFFVPVVDREVGTINSFSRWEQAFRVFSSV